jgi:hypothetical protein
MNSHTWRRGKDKATIGCHGTRGDCDRYEIILFLKEKGATTNKEAVMETSENFYFFSKRAFTRIQPAGFMENGSVRRMSNKFIPLREIDESEFTNIKFIHKLSKIL